MSQSSAQNLLATIYLDKNLKPTSVNETEQKIMFTRAIGSTLDSSGKSHEAAAILPASYNKTRHGQQ